MSIVFETWSAGVAGSEGFQVGPMAGRRKLKKSLGTLKLIVGVFDSDADGAARALFRSARRR